MSFEALGRFSATTVLVLVSACASLPTPDADARRELGELFARLDPPVEGALEVREASLTIDSSRLGGTFQSVLVGACAPSPRVRLQLLPDVGGKVLDLVASTELVRGYMPHASIGIDVDLASGASLPRHVLVLIATTALENVARLELDRVRGAWRREDGGWTLRIASALPGGEVQVELAQDGTVLRREYRASGLRWTETLHPEHRIESSSMQVFIDESLRERAEGLTPDVFELELPAGLSL